MVTFLDILLTIILVFVGMGLALLIFGLFSSFSFFKKIKLIFLKIALKGQEKVDSVKSSVKGNSTGLEHSQKYLVIKERFDLESKLTKGSEHIDTTIKTGNKILTKTTNVIFFFILLFVIAFATTLSIIIYLITKLFS